jgi:hypothetical protein
VIGISHGKRALRLAELEAVGEALGLKGGVCGDQVQGHLDQDDPQLSARRV